MDSNVCPRCQRPALVQTQNRVENSWRTYLLRVAGILFLIGLVTICAYGIVLIILATIIAIFGLFLPSTVAGTINVQCLQCGLVLPPR